MHISYKLHPLLSHSLPPPYSLFLVRHLKYHQTLIQPTKQRAMVEVGILVMCLAAELGWWHVREGEGRKGREGGGRKGGVRIEGLSALSYIVYIHLNTVVRLELWAH